MQIFGWLAHRITHADRIAALPAAVERMERDFGTWRVAWGRINRFQWLSGR